MARTGLGVGIGVAAVAALAFGGYSYNQYQKQASLQRGISQTQQALQQVDQLIQQNQTQLLSLWSQLGIDAGTGVEVLGTAGSEHERDRVTPLGDAVDVFQTASNTFDATTAFQNGQYLEALGHLGETAATIWEHADPTEWKLVLAGGKAAIDVGANVLEASALLSQQTHLIQTQLLLQQQLLKLQVNDPQTLAEWQQVLSNLHGDPASEHEAFLKWLATHGLSEKDVITKALSNANQAGGATPSQVASGITILAPETSLDEIASIPQINPDFIAAMQAEQFISSHAASDSRWFRYSVSHYPDGTYIPAFGPCRGIDIPNPISGGLISSSTASCRSGVIYNTANGSAPTTDAPIDLNDPQNFGRVFEGPGNGTTGIRVVTTGLEGPGQAAVLVYGSSGNVSCYSNGFANSERDLSLRFTPKESLSIMSCDYTDSPTGTFKVGICAPPRPDWGAYVSTDKDGNLDGGCSGAHNDKVPPKLVYEVPVTAGRLSHLVVHIPWPAPKQ